jgi:Protein of unknown function (DUF3300)
MKADSFRGRLLTCILAAAVILELSPLQVRLYGQDSAPPPDQAPSEQPAPAKLTPQQLRQLVAPIALFPDALVAQILAASAYPTQIVEAERFLEQNPNLKGKELGDAVDQQAWDPSVKSLCQFPSVLANMDKDLSWTSELGDANVNQQAEVMDAIQYMRHQAQQAGNLKSTPQQTVTDEGDDIDIAPSEPDVVYVPEYNPLYVYGYPVGWWPGFVPWWDVGGPYISFGIGFGIGPFFGFGWGWPHWGFNWFGHGIVWGGQPYIFHSHAFYDHYAYFRGGFHPGPAFAPGDRGFRGFGAVHAPAARGAFGGVARGGDVRGFASRGHASFGGGGFHGGGGGGRR